MAYTKPYLSSSAVNGGSPIYLNGTEISHTHKNNLNPPEIPTKITTSDVIGTVDFLGWENARIKIQGIFNAIDTGNNLPTVDLLKSYAKETSGVYIYDPVFFTSATQIAIENLNMQRKTDSITTDGSIKGPLVYYSIDAILTE